MNADVFARWEEDILGGVIRTASSYWSRQGPLAHQAFPYHLLIEPSEEELAQVFKLGRALCARYSTPLHAPLGRLSYHVVCDDKTYSLEALDKYVRRDVKRCLRRATVERVSFERLAGEGWLLRRETLLRQGRGVHSASGEAWRRLCRGAMQLPGFEAWAVLMDDRIAASLIAVQVDRSICFTYQMSLNEYLKHYVNKALAAVVTQEMLGRSGVDSVLYGLHGLDASESVDEFKFRMGFRVKPVRQRVVLRPPFDRLATPTTHAILRRILGTGDKSRYLKHYMGKLEGIVRWYLEGKLPLESQPLPKPLEGISLT